VTSRQEYLKIFLNTPVSLRQRPDTGTQLKKSAVGVSIVTSIVFINMSPDAAFDMERKDA